MTKPTIRELLDDSRREGILHCGSEERLAERVEAVLRLHVPYESCDEPTCVDCGCPWPCPTLRALEGEESR